MKKPYKIFQEMLLECAANYDPETYVMAKALVALNESELDDISTDDKIADKFMKHVSEPHVEVYTRSETPGIAPYGTALTSYVNSKEGIDGFDKNLVLCKFWDETIPKDPEFSKRYPNKCLKAIDELKEKKPEIVNNLSALKTCVDKSIDNFKSFDLHAVPKTEINPKVKYSEYKDVEDNVNQKSFDALNSHMESALDEKTMDAYNRVLFYVPFIESFSDHVDSVMRSSICKNRNYVTAGIATATYEAVINNVIAPYEGETILNNVNAVTMNEFSVGNMMPIVGITPECATKMTVTPAEKVEKLVGKPVDPSKELEDGDVVNELASYMEKLVNESVVDKTYESVVTYMTESGNTSDERSVKANAVITGELPSVNHVFTNESALIVGFNLLEKGVEYGSDIAKIYESCFGEDYGKIAKLYLEAAEEKTNPVFISEVKKLWNKLFKWMDFDGKNKDEEFKKALGTLKSNITFSFKDKSDAAIGAIKKAISGQGFEPIHEDDDRDTEKFTGGIHIVCRFNEKKGALFVKYDKNVKKDIKESMDADEASVIRQEILETVEKVFKENGFNPKISEKDKKQWINMESKEFGGALCIAGLGNSGSKISKCCSEINKEIKKHGGKITPDNYGTAFLKVDHGTVITETAGIDEDMIKPVAELNAKGYKVKYSCAGHINTKVKEDRNKDLIKYGKLYSTARITFDGKVDLKSIPERWERKDNEDGDTCLYVKPYTYNEKQGTPAEAFDKWKEAYMVNLTKWIDDLPNKGKSEDKDVSESTFDNIFNSFYYNSL